MLCASFSTFPVRVTQTGLSLSPSTVVCVDPCPASAPLGGVLTVNVTVVDVSDLGGWEFKLYWLREKLNGTGIVEGPFLKQINVTYFNIINFTDNYNSTHGLAWVEAVLLGSGPGAYGSGTLASISFQAKNVGSTGLWLSETLLVDSEAKLIPHTAANGVVYIMFHNIAITGVSPSKTVVGQGYGMNISVTIENQGNYTESFKVTVYANSSPCTSQNVTLASGNSSVITAVWDTSRFAKGNYTISAYATPVPGETDTTDNTFPDGTIVIAIPSDINADFKVDIKDLVLVIKYYGSYPGSVKPWNPNADVNCDNKVDVKDLVLVIKHFGQHYP